MRNKNLPLLFVALLLGGIACAQDGPSLGDLARQQKQQREQSKAAGKTSKASRVITNQDIASPGIADPQAPEEKADPGETTPTSPSTASKQSADYWSSQISTQKAQIASLQAQIKQLNDSIRFAPANCRGNCVEWNERQRQKQEEVERMQAQLEEQKKQLEELQESARKQGYGSAVYDP
jgi:predicted RNase H-like nuclease (RuvC/YqgF family)